MIHILAVQCAFFILSVNVGKCKQSGRTTDNPPVCCPVECSYGVSCFLSYHVVFIYNETTSLNSVAL